MYKFALVPAYNEEKHIDTVVKEIVKLGIKPVVVDDGSTDNTFQVAKKSGGIALRNNTNKGKGEALSTGFNYLFKNHPEMKYLVIIDADMQYEPKESVKLLKELEKNQVDFIMGYRNWSEVPLRHRMGNFVWKTAFNIMFGTRLKDTNCGLMVFNKKAVEKLRNHILGGYVVDNSILIGALKNNLRIKQLPVKVHYHIKSKIGRGVRVLIGVLIYILKEGLKYRLGRKN